MISDRLNPYESPRTQSNWPIPASKHLPCRASLLGSGWRYRRLRLEGRWEAEIEWNARWPAETIKVNGRRVVSKHVFWYAPHFSVELETSLGVCVLSVNVRLSCFDTVKSFQVCVDDEVVYTEGENKISKRK